MHSQIWTLVLIFLQVFISHTMNRTAYHMSINKPYMLIMTVFCYISLVLFYAGIQKTRPYQ